MEENFLQKKENGRGKASFVFFVLLAGVLILLDQWTKHLAFTGSWGNFLDSLGLGIRKYNFANSQFAFSLPVPVFLMYGFYFVALFLIGRFLVLNFRRLAAANLLAWALVVAGALANVAERVALGYVRDFIYVYHGIFNLADIYIILGVVILLAGQLKPKIKT